MQYAAADNLKWNKPPAQEAIDSWLLITLLPDFLCAQLPRPADFLERFHTDRHEWLYIKVLGSFAKSLSNQRPITTTSFGCRRTEMLSKIILQLPFIPTAVRAFGKLL